MSKFKLILIKVIQPVIFMIIDFITCIMKFGLFLSLPFALIYYVYKAKDANNC